MAFDAVGAASQFTVANVERRSTQEAGTRAQGGYASNGFVPFLPRDGGVNYLEVCMNAPNYIKVWRFYDAPEELRALSTHGGDEDWLALIPPKLASEWIGWLEEGHSFGCCSVSTHSHPELPGYEIRIGAHA
jgi:hypothetical protein